MDVRATAWRTAASRNASSFPFEVTACRFAGLDEEVSQYHRQDQPAARVQLKWWARAGMLLSNLEAAEIVERHDRRDPVPVADANRVIYGTDDPLLPC